MQFVVKWQIIHFFIQSFEKSYSGNIGGRAIKPIS